MVDIIEHMTQYTVVVPESIQLLVGNVTPIFAVARRRGRKQLPNLFRDRYFRTWNKSHIMSDLYYILVNG